MPARPKRTRRSSRKADSEFVERLANLNAALSVQRTVVWPLERPSALFPALFPEEEKTSAVIGLRIGEHQFSLDDRVCGILIEALQYCRNLAQRRHGRVRPRER